VIINGNPACHIKSIFSKSQGNEPGTKKGIKSRKIKGEASFITGSSDVYIEGEKAVRAGDMMVSNNENTPPAPLMQPSTPPPQSLEMEQQEAREITEGQDILMIRVVGQVTYCSVEITVDSEFKLQDNHSEQAKTPKIHALDSQASEDEQRHDDEGKAGSNQTTSDNKTNPAEMDVSMKLIEWLKKVEGPLHLLPYDDQTGKKIEKWTEGATIGYGHLITRQEWNRLKKGITEQQAHDLFLSDLKKAVKAVQELVETKLTQGQFDALISLTYNIGRGNFASSSILKMINCPQENAAYSTQEEAFKAWKKSQGNVMEGLINRRNAEWNIFSKGIYELW
jgi:GH24 family phage-related lysozyme (muramidase)/uncharacterized Zn-binding protein involved in type VI secretion